MVFDVLVAASMEHQKLAHSSVCTYLGVGNQHSSDNRVKLCYESPRPTSGIHRLVFVLFKQPGRQSIHAPGWRQNFITRDFAEYYNLGSPVAAVYFNCQRQSGSGGRRLIL
ncbi:hypothetical protein V8G54_021214 [Vigna mungo]|uniref:Flowering locus T n=1 Tax=Vigna mungo TaxID=3915 RepID=A0AAQ3NGZ2_VIGMU